MAGKISINKQSSIRISEGKTVYFDPWDVPGAGKDADVIFITHNHFDHLSAPDIKNLIKDDGVVVVPESIKDEVLKETGLPVEKLVVVTPNNSYSANGVDFETVPSYNIDKDFHKESDGFCGYIATLGGERYYVTGDMDDVPALYDVKCDVLLLPIGGTYTMTIEEAVNFANEVAPKLCIPTHYGDVVGDSKDGEKFKELLGKKNPSITVEIIK